MTKDTAGVGPVDQPVRPWGRHAGDGTPAHPAERVDQWPAHNRDRMRHAVYSLTPEEVAAVNKLRARREWMARDTARCKCDHNEYCEHCWPMSFRPGGVWHGLGA